MPKLPAKTADQVDNSEAWVGREAVEPGLYPGRLVKVEVRDSKSGPFPYWSWEYDLLGDGDGHKVWHTTSLSPKALGGMKAVFIAYHATPDTDTDLLVGRVIGLEVSTATAQSGKRQGKLVNTVELVVPWEGDEYDTVENPAEDDLGIDDGEF
jgi:hypothetical protein